MTHRDTNTGLSRREALALLAAAPMATAFACSGADAARAQRAIEGDYQPTFFTAHEYETVRLLVDILIPRDERSGSATDAGTPEFMDFLMTDQPERQLAMRGGLAWLDVECRARFDNQFVDCDATQHASLLDEIAYPERARPELSHGVEFLNGFRNLTATGFFSSKMGVEDLEYVGNEFVPEWTGCPDEALRKLGLT
jgi:gluconate 2-dehydrogenase gamma chain